MSCSCDPVFIWPHVVNTDIPDIQNGRISTFGVKSDVTIVFLDPDFLKGTKISAIRVHLRQT